jgi:hypothetical protein
VAKEPVIFEPPKHQNTKLHQVFGANLVTWCLGGYRTRNFEAPKHQVTPNCLVQIWCFCALVAEAPVRFLTKFRTSSICARISDFVRVLSLMLLSV